MHNLQRIAEGLSEDEAWRLFQQIVDALVHMSSLGIVCGQLVDDIQITNWTSATQRHQAYEYFHWCDRNTRVADILLICLPDGKGDCKGKFSRAEQLGVVLTDCWKSAISALLRLVWLQQSSHPNWFRT
jgi:hypothetical protein